MNGLAMAAKVFEGREVLPAIDYITSESPVAFCVTPVALVSGKVTA